MKTRNEWNFLLGLSLALYIGAVQAQDASPVLISSPGVSVTRADFEAEIQRVPKEKRFEFRANPQRVGKMIDKIYVNRSATQQARKAGLDKEEALATKLALAQEAILSNAWFEHLKESADLPDFTQAAREGYKASPERFMSKPEVSASHILIKQSSRTAEEALQRAQEVREKALKGEPFDKLAEEYSEDPTAKANKGSLGSFTQDKMVREFSEAAFAMKEGEISEPVKTRYGYHILKVHKMKPAELQPFEVVEKDLVKELKSNYLTGIHQDAMTGILNTKDIKVHEEAIAALVSEMPEPDSKLIRGPAKNYAGKRKKSATIPDGKK